MNSFPSNVKLLSTSRFIEGGSSQGNFKNFNLALHVGDKQGVVLANRDLVTTIYHPRQYGLIKRTLI